MKKAEVKKVNAPKVQAKVDTKVEVKTETKKVETKKVASPKVEAKKVEAKKVETPKTEAKKLEVKKVETKAETKKPVEVKTETKTETPKVVAPKAETKPAEIKKPVETPRVEIKTDANGKPLSIGATIRQMFSEALKAGKIKAEQVKILVDEEKTYDVLGIRYAFLKVATDNPDDRKISGFARYGKQTVNVGGKTMWICNDLYKRNVPKFAEWIKSLK